MDAVVVARTTFPLAERLVVDAFPSVLCPVTERVPLDVNDEVAVIDPIVAVPPKSDEIPPVTALKVVAKRLEDVALVKVALVAVRVVMIAVARLARVAKKLEDVALVLRRLVIVPLVAKRLVEVIPVEDALERVVWPVTVRVDAVVVAKVEVPVTAREPVVVLLRVERLVIDPVVE